jgi:hypothetical protein
MTAGITAALIVTAALGASFRTTKQIAIAATAALVFLYPSLAVVVLLALAFCWRQTKR